MGGKGREEKGEEAEIGGLLSLCVSVSVSYTRAALQLSMDVPWDEEWKMGRRGRRNGQR